VTDETSTAARTSRPTTWSCCTPTQPRWRPWAVPTATRRLTPTGQDRLRRRGTDGRVRPQWVGHRARVQWVHSAAPDPGWLAHPGSQLAGVTGLPLVLCAVFYA